MGVDSSALLKILFVLRIINITKPKNAGLTIKSNKKNCFES